MCSSITEKNRHRKLFHPNSKVKELIPEDSQGGADKNDDDSDRDADNCNAIPCKIDDIISKSKDHVDWIQCRLCPKWYHAYCVNVEEDVAYLFECDKDSD